MAGLGCVWFFVVCLFLTGSESLLCHTISHINGKADSANHVGDIIGALVLQNVSGTFLEFSGTATCYSYTYGTCTSTGQVGITFDVQASDPTYNQTIVLSLWFDKVSQPPHEFLGLETTMVYPKEIQFVKIQFRLSTLTEVQTVYPETGSVSEDPLFDVNDYIKIRQCTP